jgi:hypothetical protein
MNKLNHNLKRFSQKIGVKFLRVIDLDGTKNVKSQFENESISICHKLIRDPQSTLIMSPLSGKRYIESKNHHIHITIEQNLLTITNHQYSYHVDIFGKAYSRIQKIFDSELNNRCNEYENEIYSNIKHSLTNIYKNINHEFV